MVKPKVSIVVVSYNMARELPRTLYTLRAPYQRNMSNDEIEIIVVDNGSSDDVVLDDEWQNVRLLRVKNPTHSPVPAVNLGLANASADLIGVMIDGARMASPSMLYYATLASNLAPRVVISTMAYHLGPDVQIKSVKAGYNQQREDDLLNSVPWQEDGYRLFDISVLASSSSNGWFKPIDETNALFTSSELWSELGGFDEDFEALGGGLANLDTYLRATELSDSLLVSLLGEGTFHQVHGGIATNQQREDASWKVFHEEYVKLRGKNFKKTDIEAVMFGQLGSHHKRSVFNSLEKL